MSLRIQLKQNDPSWKRVSGLKVGPSNKDKREGPEEVVTQGLANFNLINNQLENLNMVIWTQYVWGKP